MILVTGATGFLGAELAKQLIQLGLSIRCTRRQNSIVPQILASNPDIEWVIADITNISALGDAFEGITQVYHCAALVSFADADGEKMIYNNITGTANIVNLCLENNVRLIHVSSIAAIGQAKPGNLINENNFIEDTPTCNPYAVSKLESEMEVWRGIAEGLDAVIVNPSLIIGAAAGKNGSGKLFESVRKGISFYTSGSAGFVDVMDVAKCMITLMNSNITGERFIINAENRYFKELLPTIARKFGIKPPGFEAKPWMLELAWRISGLASVFTGKPRLDRVTARYATMEQNYDSAKIKKAIDFEFKPIDDTIDEIIVRLNSY